MSKTLLFSVPVLLTVTAVAQETSITPISRNDVQVANAAASRSAAGVQDDEGHKITGVLSSTVTSAYFFRGILQEDQGFILQPSMELSFGLFEGKEGAINSGSLTLGTWNSLHTGPTGTGSGNQLWYESDFYAGLTLGVFDHAKAGMVYTAYASPNGVFATTQELAFSFSYDDKASWGKDTFSGLQPSVTVAFELSGQADGGNDTGIYGEIGIQPAFTFQLGEKLPLTVSLPLTLGFSLDNYYERAGDDNPFGFLDLGVSGSVPLTFVPGRFGAWSASAGVDFLFLGDTTEAINGNENFEILGSLSVSCAF